MSYKQLLEKLLEIYGIAAQNKIELEIVELRDYPKQYTTTFTLNIKRNRDLLYKRSFIQDNKLSSGGDQEICLIAIEDIACWGLNKIEKDFDKKELKNLEIKESSEISKLQKQLSILEEKVNMLTNE